MTQAGERLMAGVNEMREIARGERPAAAITFEGRRYIPAETAEERLSALRNALLSISLGETLTAPQTARTALRADEDVYHAERKAEAAQKAQR